jgi:hypothetical protein
MHESRNRWRAAYREARRCYLSELHAMRSLGRSPQRESRFRFLHLASHERELLVRFHGPERVRKAIWTAA